MNQKKSETVPHVRRRFVDGKHGQIHLRSAQPNQISTDGPAIICLHMMPKSGRIFANLLPRLAQRSLSIAIDYPGYGESDPYPSDMKPAIPDYAASVHQAISELGLMSVNLVGYHTGSMIAVELANQFPDLVNNIVNISAPIFSEKEKHEMHQYFAPVPLDEAGTRFTQMWQRVLQYRGPGMTLEMAATSFAENLRGGERYEDGHQAAFDYSSTYVDTLTRLTQPILVMNPGDDLYVHTKRVDQHLHHGRRLDYPDWGHGFLDLHSAAVAEIILNFFRSENG